jgi:hypothetical protein
MRILILALFGLVLASTPSFAAVLTTEDQIRQAIIGNTISGIEDGKPYAEYFLPDGHLRGVEPEGPYTGEWRISGRTLCERYFTQRTEEPDPDEGSPSGWECMSVEITGSRFAWVVDGERYEASRVTGNPDNL